MWVSQTGLPFKIKTNLNANPHDKGNHQICKETIKYQKKHHTSKNTSNHQPVVVILYHYIPSCTAYFCCSTRKARIKSPAIQFPSFPVATWGRDHTQKILLILCPSYIYIHIYIMYIYTLYIYVYVYMYICIYVYIHYINPHDHEISIL